MNAKLLPEADWYRLETTSAAGLWQHLSPAWASVVVVEQGDEIIGACILLTVLHPECFWVDPAHRGQGQVAKSLWSLVQKLASDLGMQRVAAAADSEEMRLLLSHLGAERLPGDHYVLPVKES